MKRGPWPLLAAATAFLTVLFLGAPTAAQPDSGNAPPTLSFFSGGDGAHADWLATIDQPPGDTDNQAIELQTTNDAPTFTMGFAGILVHHVTGIPAAQFPDSSYWMKADVPPGTPTLGSPRLVVEFQTAAGLDDGDAELDANVFTGDWQEVSDTVAPGVQNGWDIHSAACPFVYHAVWTTAQSCHTGDVVSAVFLVADPYGIHHLIDDITVDNKTFTSASDNGGGNNDPAGPTATTDPSLLPPLIFPPL